ncbi:MAG TPA: YcnI family protein [Gaiellaceae bacterium]|nr:YcnI family protein [Gaiellaceae bacterium]
MLRRLLLTFIAAAVAFPAAAAAHVTIQPDEWEPGAFARMVVRVPNESDAAATTSVSMQFPQEVLTARFQPHPLCEREVETEALDQPVEDVTERIATVTWTCDAGIATGEFDEFGLSFQIPEDAAAGDELLFPTVQVYDDGEERAWVDPDPEAESPAPRVTVIAAEEEETEEPAATSTDSEAAVPAVNIDDDGDGTATVAIVLAIIGLAAGLVALGVALLRKPRTVG